MVYYSRRQCSNPEDCGPETPSPTMAPSALASSDHRLLRAYLILALNLILFAVLARAGYRALTRPRAPPARHHRRNSSLTMEKMMDGIEGSDRGSRDSDVRRRSVTKPE